MLSFPQQQQQQPIFAQIPQSMFQQQQPIPALYKQIQQQQQQQQPVPALFQQIQPQQQQPFLLAPQPLAVAPQPSSFQLGGHPLIAGELQSAFAPFTDAFMAKRQQTPAHHPPQQPQFGNNGMSDINSLLASVGQAPLSSPAGAAPGVPSAAPTGLALAGVPAPISSYHLPVEKAIALFERVSALSGKVPDQVLGQLGASAWHQTMQTPVDPNIFLPTRARQKRDANGQFSNNSQQGLDDPQQPQQSQQQPQQQFQQQQPQQLPFGAPGMMIPQTGGVPSMMPMMPQQQQMPGMMPQMMPMMPQQQQQFPVMAPSPLDPNKLKQQFGLPVQPQPIPGQQQLAPPQSIQIPALPQPATSTVPQAPQQQQQTQAPATAPAPPPKKSAIRPLSFACRRARKYRY